MNKNNSVVAIYPSHTAAEAAVKELQQSGFDMKKLSIVGRDYHTEQHVVGYYNNGDRMRHWGKTGAFWGWIWGCFFGSADEIIHAKEVLSGTQPETLDHHQSTRQRVAAPV
jgi:hypothetical protein